MEEVKVETNTETGGLKAKTVSLIGKIVGGSIILIGFTLKCFHVLDCEINELIKIGFAEMAVFGTIDINIALDKFLRRD
jgi:hypothetical protein